VATHLAEAAHLRLEDRDRIWIEAPEVAAAATPDGAATAVAPISHQASTSAPSTSAPTVAPATGSGTGPTGGSTLPGRFARSMSPVA